MPHRYRHIALGDTNSTNLEALEEARSGDPGNLWITAKRQVSGKGSRGRSWESPTGNLYASLLLVEPAPQESLGELAFVAALSVMKAVSALSENKAKISLKWPNDVLLNAKKCSGILLESHEINGARHVIIGVGVNCQSAPTGTPYPATSLREAGICDDVSIVFDKLKAGFAHQLDVWNKGTNFQAIRGEWLKHAHGLGDTVTVSFPNGDKKTGVFKSIDGQGLLTLEMPDGNIKQISVADLFFDR